MSADSWRKCPKCVKQDDKLHEKAMAKLESQYGKIPASDYVAKLQEVQKRKELPNTLREDWELYMEESGHLYISYSCSCRVCDFHHEHKHEQDIEIK